MWFERPKNRFLFLVVFCIEKVQGFFECSSTLYNISHIGFKGYLKSCIPVMPCLTHPHSHMSGMSLTCIDSTLQSMDSNSPSYCQIHPCNKCTQLYPHVKGSHTLNGLRLTLTSHSSFSRLACLTHFCQII